jgi:hypothetical protein
MVEKYHHVNSQWPEIIPDLTGDEAIAAAKRLYRFTMKKPFPGKWQIASGNRFTWVRRGVFYVNPNRTGALRPGWHDLVHMLSHLCHRKQFPNAKPHAANHHFIEREMVAYVIAQGWLDGRLRKPAKAKPDIKAVRAERVAAGIQRWQAKLRRAENALRKLKRQKAHYERQKPLAHDGARGDLGIQ